MLSGCKQKRFGIWRVSRGRAAKSFMARTRSDNPIVPLRISHSELSFHLLLYLFSQNPLQDLPTRVLRDRGYKLYTTVQSLVLGQFDLRELLHLFFRQAISTLARSPDHVSSRQLTLVSSKSYPEDSCIYNLALWIPHESTEAEMSALISARKTFSFIGWGSKPLCSLFQ